MVKMVDGVLSPGNPAQGDDEPKDWAPEIHEANERALAEEEASSARHNEISPGARVAARFCLVSMRVTTIKCQMEQLREELEALSHELIDAGTEGYVETGREFMRQLEEELEGESVLDHQPKTAG